MDVRRLTVVYRRGNAMTEGSMVDSARCLDRRSAMRIGRLAVCGFCALVVIRPGAVQTAASDVPTYQQFLSAPSPLEVVSARKVDRLAWTAFEEGRRNVYTAAAPAFTPVRLTSFMKDDGVDLSGIRISDDGTTVVFVRGSAPNRDGWIANPSANPDGPERAVWAARTAGGPAFRVAEASNPELAPDGSSILFIKDAQIYRAKVTAATGASEIDRGEKPFIKEWGTQSAPQWSPDGKKVAFVSTRTDHSFVAVYDMPTRTVKYMAPSVDFDGSPMWTDDSKSVVFVRRPGLPFAQQSQQGSGAIGTPNGPAFQGGTGAPTGRVPRVPGVPPAPGVPRAPRVPRVPRVLKLRQASPARVREVPSRGLRTCPACSAPRSGAATPFPS